MRACFDEAVFAEELRENGKIRELVKFLKAEISRQTSN